MSQSDGLNWLIEKIEPKPSKSISMDDLAWLIEKAQLALDLDAFVTTDKDRERLARIAREKGIA